MTIWLASGNVHKKKEFDSILFPAEIKIPSESSLLPSFAPEETGSTFVENALIKARALHEMVKEPVIADDSGLCVRVLDCRPGVHSANYGDEGGLKISASERNALLLKEMHGKNERSAFFVCTMVILLEKNRFYIVQETLEGEISLQEYGDNGFGYDPVFFIPAFGCTLAELPSSKKNIISHRAKAGKAISAILNQLNETHNEF
jgi:XTP/dITP diphosphohydrolase